MDQGDRLARETVQDVARNCYGKLIACLAARTRDVAGAEDALAEAFAAALAGWPASGVPARPEAWLLTVARRRLVDGARRRGVRSAAAEHLRLLAEEMRDAAAQESELPDLRLGLMFACAHPAIDARIRAPLMLQAVLGLDAATIGAAFLLPAATMGQRLVRAKTKIKAAGIPFSIPSRADLADRLEAVLAAIYAAFSEGWVNPAGTDHRRRELASEAIWLGRVLVELLPEEPEALGLLALMLHLEARRGARRDGMGEFVALADQDTALWRGDLIEEADAILTRASRAGTLGRYQLEAAVQSAHAIRRRLGHADWPALEKLYDRLLAITGSPVVAINRAVIVAELRGPADGLAALAALRDDRRLDDYQPYWAARADLLARAGDTSAADDAYRRAIGLEADPAVRRFLESRRGRLLS